MDGLNPVQYKRSAHLAVLQAFVQRERHQMAHGDELSDEQVALQFLGIRYQQFVEIPVDLLVHFRTYCAKGMVIGKRDEAVQRSPKFCASGRQVLRTEEEVHINKLPESLVSLAELHAKVKHVVRKLEKMGFEARLADHVLFGESHEARVRSIFAGAEHTEVEVPARGGFRVQTCRKQPSQRVRKGVWYEF